MSAVDSRCLISDHVSALTCEDFRGSAREVNTNTGNGLKMYGQGACYAYEDVFTPIVSGFLANLQRKVNNEDDFVKLQFVYSNIYNSCRVFSSAIL